MSGSNVPQKTEIVPFHGQDLLTVEVNGESYVVMHPIVEGMGLDWATQYRKLLSQKDKFNHCHMTTVAADGKQREMLCIPLTKLPGWLFSINPEKVKPEIREAVILYQEECFDVLYHHWIGKYQE